MSAYVVELGAGQRRLCCETWLNFIPSGLLGTAALPLHQSPLPWVPAEMAAGRMPSLHTQTFDFDDLRRAHCLIESDRVLGKLVVCL